MFDSTGDFARLLRCERRRWVGRRALEGLAAGAAVGSTLAMVIVWWLWYAGLPSVAATALTIGVFAVGGVVMSLLRLPSTAATAVRLDEQHGHSELFLTAASLGAQGAGDRARCDEEISKLILIRADAAARAIAGQPIVFARWTSQALALSAMGVGLTLTVASIASAPKRSLAADAATGDSSLLPHVAITSPTRGRSSAPTGLAPAGETATDAAATGDEKRLGATLGDPPTNPGTSRQTFADAAMNGASEGAGAGRGAARSPLYAPPVGFAEAAPDDPAPASSDGASRSTGAGGPGAAGGREDVRGRVHSMSAGPPPWNTPGWASARQSAETARQGGEVPAAYRDLVRDYFAR